jgi:hypothetical protein
VVRMLHSSVGLLRAIAGGHTRSTVATRSLPAISEHEQTSKRSVLTRTTSHKQNTHPASESTCTHIHSGQPADSKRDTQPKNQARLHKKETNLSAYNIVSAQNKKLLQHMTRKGQH